MMRPNDVAVFSSEIHTQTVVEMRARSEDVHAKGEDVFNRTGRMDPLVNVYGKTRKSRFVWTPNPDTTFTLMNGYKRPYIFATDGTGSFKDCIGKAFEASARIFAMLNKNSTGQHQMDFSFAVCQDREDEHGVLQIPQFESDNRFAEHIRLLVPDGAGGDVPEDYDLAIWYAANRVRADLHLRYGGKGIFVMLLDAPGRGVVEKHLVDRHLGVKIQSNVSTAVVWQKLLEQYHGFVVVFGSPDTAYWWQDVVGQGHVVLAPSRELFAEVQAGLVYVTDNVQPTQDGLAEFLRADGQNIISENAVRSIWQCYLDANVPFGANAKISIYLPRPGDIFADMSHMYPIGHENFDKNDSSPIYDMTSEENLLPPTKPAIDWTQF